jgi:predicted aminopeptidase
MITPGSIEYDRIRAWIWNNFQIPDNASQVRIAIDVGKPIEVTVKFAPEATEQLSMRLELGSQMEAIG